MAMHAVRWALAAGVIAAGLLALIFYDWTRLSCHELLSVSGWVLDEAKCAGRSADTFRAAGLDPGDGDERAYFSDMNGAISLTNEESAGRIMWMVWTGGNDRFWDKTIRNTFGAFDFLKVLSSHPEAGYCAKEEGSYQAKSKLYNSDLLDENYWILNRQECKNAGGRWHTISRDNRWNYFGLVNEPCFEKASERDKEHRDKHYGLWLDKRKSSSTDPTECPDDPFQNEDKYPGVKIGARGTAGLPIGSYYGEASGVLGLRLFPNPDFDEEAADKWDAKKFYEEPVYYNDKDLIRPYRVGMSCAFCHVGPDPVRPPEDPENPKWENLSSTVGAQYLWLDRAFLWSPQDHQNFVYQLVRTGRPGTFDTSLVSNDNINNPRTMNAVYGVGPRLKAALRWGKEKLAGGNLNNRQFNDYPEIFKFPQKSVDGAPFGSFFEPPNKVWTPRVLKDGSDSAGVLASLNRVYLNIGTFSEEWLLHFFPFVGATPFTPITPIKVSDAQKNSAYWNATEAQMPLMAQFLANAKVSESHSLEEALKNNLEDALKSNDLEAIEQSSDLIRKLETDPDDLETGKKAFADHCARCHSSKIPVPAVGLDDESCSDGKNYLKCWNKYWAWTKTDGFKDEMRKIVGEEDFLKDNYLSTDIRVPVDLLQTNICSALATNAIAGDIWDNFSSQTYKELPSVGSVEVFPAWGGDTENTEFFRKRDPSAIKTHTYEMPAGGRGYIRPPSLISIWSTAPFLLNNELGPFTQDPSVEARLKSFEESIDQLLNPKRRPFDEEAFKQNKPGAGRINRTTTKSYLVIPAGYLPDALAPLRNWLSRWFPWLFQPSGDLKIGPIPKGTPVDLLANLDLAGPGVSVLLGAKETLEKLPQEPSDEQVRKAFQPLVQDMLRASKCPDFVINKGHYFGTDFFDEEEPLTPDQKRSLIQFLKTF
jgi:hypothetical protein